MSDNTIQVLMIACRYETGGAPRSMMEMVTQLSNTYGVKFTLALGQEGKLSKWCDENKIDYVISNHFTFADPLDKKIRINIKRVIRMIIRNCQAQKKIEKTINVGHFDIIHTNSNRDNFGAMLAKKYKVPHIWHLREYGKEDYDNHFFLPFSVSYMNSNTNKFIAISKGVKTAWQQQGINSEKIVQIYNGVRKSEIKKKQTYKEQSEKLKIVFTGSIVPSKGQLEIISALLACDELIRNSYCVDFYYDGYDQSYLSELKNMVNKYSASECFNFCGANYNIFNTLCNYDIGITCSKSEAFGRVTVEYMAAGLITIASNTGANPEIIDDGVNGFLYEYGNPESLGNLLKKVYYLSRQQKSEIGKAAIEKVEHNFTDEINARNIYELYTKLINFHQEK